MSTPDEGTHDPMNERLELLETLAAYAAGDLDDAARAEVEALLESDPEARTSLERITGVNELLAATPSPEPPSGARERLMAALDPVLADQLNSASEEPLPWPRRVTQWLRNGALMPRLAAGAAALVVIAGAGIGLSQIGGRDDTSTVALDMLEGGGDAGDGEAAAGSLAPTAANDRSLFAGGVYDETSAMALLDQYAAQRIREDLAAPEPQADQPQVEDDALAESLGTGAEDELFAAVDQCADKPFASEGGRQLRGELATFNDEPAILYIIERPDASLELWVVEQGDCGILLFHTAE